MIPVGCAPEPPGFDARVRQRGLAAIDELVGRTPRKGRPGPRRKRQARERDAIPSRAFPPFWREALDDMLVAYHRRCAFLTLYLENATSTPSIDHMVAKSHDWTQVYEWSNYRLAAALINAKKRDLDGLIDPFECGEGWFALEFTAFQVVPGARAPDGREAALNATLELLNAPECLRAREEYVREYLAGHIDWEYLQRRAPFVASELERQRMKRKTRAR